MEPLSPGPADPFASTFQSPEGCNGCLVALDCVSALVAARRAAYDAASARMGLVDQMKQRDAGGFEGAIRFMGDIGAGILGSTIEAIEADEHIAGITFTACAGYDNGCGLPREEKADVAAISVRWPAVRRRSV